MEALKGFFTGVIDFVKNNWQGLLLMLVNPFAGHLSCMTTAKGSELHQPDT